MDFYGRLDSAERSIQLMRTASTVDEFTRQFLACVGSLRAAQYRMESATTKRLRKQPDKATAVPRFKEWWSTEKEKFKTDPLLAWIEEARDQDVHRGGDSIVSVHTYVEYLDTSDLGPPPVPGASVAFGQQGVMWVYTDKRGRTKTIPIPHPGVTSQVAAVRPPETHLGVALVDKSPIALCELALEYYERLAERLADEFPVESPSA